MTQTRSPARRTSRGQPRYRELADKLAAAITSGELDIGDHLPGEHELVATYGVSRYTVREALRVLEELGLIGRRQGIGTVVKSSRGSRGYVHSISSPAELLQYPDDTRLRIQSRDMVEVDRQLARQLGCRSGEAWLKLGGMRCPGADGAPLCWTDVYLRPEFAVIEPYIGKTARPVYALIEEHCGEETSDVSVELSAGVIPEHLCEPLRCPPGTPSLRIVRRYNGRDGRLFEMSVAEHPGDRFNYSFALARGWRGS